LCVSIVAGGVCLSAARGAFAIEPRLTQLDCTFTSAASGTWTATGAQAQVRPRSVLEFRFDHIDAERDTANRTVGALTVATLMTVKDGLVQFIEPPANGEMAITSVVMAGRARRFPASYSRTMFYAYSGPGFTSVPQAEQYYGYCVPSPQ
jgi:hypothetical protein